MTSLDIRAITLIAVGRVTTIALFDAVALTGMARLADKEPTAFYVDQADRPVQLVDPASGVNLIAFETGWGDGHYPVWIGRTRGGPVACFIVDMLMLAPPVRPADDPH